MLPRFTYVSARLSMSYTDFEDERVIVSSSIYVYSGMTHHYYSFIQCEFRSYCL